MKLSERHTKAHVGVGASRSDDRPDPNRPLVRHCILAGQERYHLAQVLGGFILSATLYTPVYSQGIPAVESPKTVIRLPANGLSDAQQSVYMSIIPFSVDQSAWPEIKVADEQSLSAVVDKYFDYYPKDYPVTSAKLVGLISKSNGLTTTEVSKGQVLRLPPVPVRPKAGYPKAPTRFFDPFTLEYVVEGANPGPAAAVNELAPAKDLDAVRTRSFTDISLQLTRAVIDRAVLESGEVTIATETLTAADCTDGQRWLDTSPFVGELRKRTTSLTPQQLAILATKAKAHPLVIVDWDFTGQSGDHGSDVLSVARYVLISLHLESLSSSIATVNPFPTSDANRQYLLSALQAYKEQLYPPGRPELAPNIDIVNSFGRARDWINNYNPRPADGTLGAGKISRMAHELVLSALLNREFGRAGATINLSFGVFGRVMGFLLPRDLQKSTSFGVLAAGNEAEANPLSMPQDQAANAAQLVTVTYGTPSGNVLGSFSNARARLPVTIVGPGCGFKFESIIPKTSGSSFAAPYVAALAWVKSLLDDTGALDMRNELIRSSRSTAELDHPVESDGVFDPALLLAPRTTRLVSPSSQVQLSENVTLQLTLGLGPTRTISMLLAHNDKSPSASAWVYVHRCGSNTCAAVRQFEDDNTSPSGLHVYRGVLKDAFLTYAQPSGSTTQVSGVEAVASVVREITF